MNLLRKLELPVGLLLFVSGSAFLLKMCYLSLAFNTIFGVLFLVTVYGYIRVRHDINIPLVLLLFVFAAMQVDALGNYFRLYGHEFGPHAVRRILTSDGAGAGHACHRLARSTST